MTEKKPGEFNHKDGVTLKEHFETIVKLSIEDMNRYFESRLKSLETQIFQAKDAMEHRLVGMNEIRSTLTDQADTFARKTEVKTEFDSLNREIKDFHDFKEERAGVPADIAALEKDVKVLNSFKDTMEAKASQTDVDKVQRKTDANQLFTIFSILIALISLFLRFLDK